MVGILFTIVNFFRTGRLNNSAKSFIKECFDNLKNKDYSQSFSETITDYILNPQTNELEESPIPKNVQAYIQSYVDTALNNVLDRFLPQQIIQDDDGVADFTQYTQDLASFGAVLDMAEDYREKFGLDEKMSAQDIFKYVQSKADNLKEKLSKTMAEKEGGVDDGQTSQVK